MSAAISDPVRRRLLGRALSLSMAVAPFGLAFGVLCAQAGLHPLTALGFSVLVFTGSAQFAAVAVLANAGTVAAAVVAGLLLNVRCLAFGLVMAPVFPRSWARRVLASQLMIDESMAVGTSVDERGCSVGSVSPPRERGDGLHRGARVGSSVTSTVTAGRAVVVVLGAAATAAAVRALA